MASTEAGPSSNPYAGKTWFWIGAAIAICGFIWPLQTARFVFQASKASGQVVAVETVSYDEGGTGYRPIFEFVDAEGVTHTLRPRFAWAWCSYVAGQPVQILYDRENAAKAEVVSFRRLWFGPLLAMGLCFLLGSLPWLERRYHRRVIWIHER